MVQYKIGSHSQESLLLLLLLSPLPLPLLGAAPKWALHLAQFCHLAF